MAVVGFTSNNELFSLFQMAWHAPSLYRMSPIFHFPKPFPRQAVEKLPPQRFERHLFSSLILTR